MTPLPKCPICSTPHTKLPEDPQPCDVCNPVAQYAFRLGRTEMKLDHETRRADQLALLLFAKEISIVAKYIMWQDGIQEMTHRVGAFFRHMLEGKDAQN